MDKLKTAIGLMSGTSLDGIDVALIRTDGQNKIVLEPSKTHAYPFSSAVKNQLKEALHKAAQLHPIDEQPEWLKNAVQLVTKEHVTALSQFIANNQIEPESVELIGFHGQTLIHRPEIGWSLQIGNAQELATQIQIPVVGDLRQNDLINGGQGAPLVPVFHQALGAMSNLSPPFAVINIGGVANISWCGSDERLVAFDTGPGNALLDDWVSKKTGGKFSYDKNGQFSSRGSVCSDTLDKLLANDYFNETPPKSLDRNAFETEVLNSLSLEDGATTLCAFSVASIEKALPFLPDRPKNWIIVGGGSLNPTLMNALENQLTGHFVKAESLGWSAEFMEAQAFAYLAVRSSIGLPVTFPDTTGVGEPKSGGKLYHPARSIS